MSFLIRRKTFKIGQSRAITLPLGWCNFYRDRIKTVTVVGHSILILAPQGFEAEAQRLIEQVEGKDQTSIIGD